MDHGVDPCRPPISVSHSVQPDDILGHSVSVGRRMTGKPFSTGSRREGYRPWVSNGLII